mmetsp:Transcript_7211/g.8141  ORF Transcript_7211/g.8141 Transcript_7211/m.8141 type:complete len:211 (-) Transcript_7211:748-1380(-)|eukprot:CAMPEP_0205805892 /NCGR_PEP_ID=MMETSP0205-20121125/9252_1 /ASSEMBLY_ACC=CAM_ASM_000278 /TAXON_ID=36767 /ORGANISM="Euplotes focardii, Strain TN1" /LENGTH=210 /DNA_ID=CAMNT_0053077837 /DNA_START=365 /DNA_END=997 /DNA_ORIENTATION=+
MVMPPKSIPPSIPMRKLPPNAHTGKRGDIPGPANYNPDHNIIKTKQRVIDFSKKQKSREIFNNPSANNPGPGVYDLKSFVQEEGAKEKSGTAKSSMFISKVPNCKDTKDDNGIPGPGSYIDKKKKKSIHTRSHSYRVEPNGRGFLTGTKREGYWDNTLEAPFTKGTNSKLAPGPGKYHKKKNSEATKTRGSSQQAIKQAFDSSEARICLK